MLAITFRVEPHLLGAAPSDVADLAQARADQARTITAYQLHVHREFFEPMIRSGSPAQAAHARAMKVECIMLAEEFRAFMRVWSIESVIDQWPAYQAAALELRDRIRTHISNMKQGMTPMTSGTPSASSIRSGSLRRGEGCAVAGA